MEKKWLVAAGLALILAVVGLASCTTGGINVGSSGSTLGSKDQQQGIFVTGEGKVMAVPDVATLSLGVEAQAATVAEAQAQVSEAIDRVMTSLTDSGVAKKDIQTQYFNIQKVTRWDNDKQQEILIGYRVTYMVTVKVRQIDEAGAIIDAVAVAGGDLTRVNSISLDVDDPSMYYAEARQKAVEDAKVKAKQLASLAEVKMGKPIYISESAYTPRPIYRQDLISKTEGAPAVETPISPGEIEITMNVQLVYPILD